LTLREIAECTIASTIIQIIPNFNVGECLTVTAVFVWTAAPDHNRDIFQYVNDKVIGLFPSITDPNVLRVVVKHTEE